MKIDPVFIKTIFPHLELSKTQVLAGGSINQAYCLEFTDGSKFFIKSNTEVAQSNFEAEKLGLKALVSKTGPKVAKALFIEFWQGKSFIVMEFIEEGIKTSKSMHSFGEKLASMHKELINKKAGFCQDNFIGSTVQKNTENTDWLEFFGQQRLLFQAKLALDKSLITSTEYKQVENIVKKLDNLLPQTEEKNLLHGDLWGGNYLIDKEGEAVLIDPAVYYGHYEADLAMTRLFGGFSQEFYSGYHNVQQIDGGFAERVDLYNLYHLLNHLNLFGRSYYQSVVKIVNFYD